MLLLFLTIYKGGTMPRHSRKKSSIRTYHIVIKGADRQLLFEETKDYKKYLEILEQFKEECNFQIFAYCLMDNHVHLLIHHSPEYSLETIFRKINTTYAIWFNMKYKRTGFVQNGRYYSEPVEDVRYLLTVLKYIHFNPMKAGLEPSPGMGYPWSSFYDYGTRKCTLTDTSPIYKIIGDYNDFEELHMLMPDQECLEINQFRKRLPDDVAKDIIFEQCGCKSVTDFQKLPLKERNKNILLLRNEGLSIRQLNRLTGIPKGVIERLIRKKNETKGAP